MKIYDKTPFGVLSQIHTKIQFFFKKMAKIQSFQAAIQAHDSGGAFVEIPFDVEQVYGKKRVKIIATIDGEPYRGSLVRMGMPCHMLLIRKDIRTKIGKQAGDRVDISIQEDTEPRVVTVAEDFQKAMDAVSGIRAFFGALSYTHQKEYVQWIEGAKREATRARRINKAVEMMKMGKKGR